MNKDHIKGAIKQVEGKSKAVAGNLIGSPKLVIEGKTEAAVGKVQSAVGTLKDKVKK
ncbi:CsbD family protein [Rhizobium alvei]|uniref:CsbD family protein n=1 Tax=Rhizobium alvei TaxID=1132659 RepID=A0ABT8YP15_9HYPH|nr:CsbD family protein [Rhizobium alvei]MDO6965460.1 CsbD family protein [Rhizobium alvei]